jgi:hypothetical protein
VIPGDPRAIRSLGDAFDLRDQTVHTWELELIWTAVEEGLVRFDEHAAQAAIDDFIPVSSIFRVIQVATRVSKDIDLESGRQLGINFEGKDSTGKWIRVKVSWFGGYVVATVHRL